MATSKSNTHTKQRRPKRKRLSLHLLNDNTHSFEYVNDVLRALLPMCNRLRAEQIAVLVHRTGECKIYTGFPPEIYLLYAKFKESRLQVQLRDYTKKK